jgi:hypothetical protein
VLLCIAAVLPAQMLVMLLLAKDRVCRQLCCWSITSAKPLSVPLVSPLPFAPSLLMPYMLLLLLLSLLLRQAKLHPEAGMMCPSQLLFSSSEVRCGWW